MVTGERDPLVPPEAAAELAARLHGELAVLPAGGALELLLGEKSGSVLPDRLVAFLDRHRAGCVSSGTVALG